MALGRDLLGDLGIDDLGDDEGMAQLELLSPRDEQKLMSGQRAGLGGAGYSGGQANYIDEEQRRENRLNDCLCPITHEIMRDPVIDALGHSYERKAIETWLSRNRTSPITNAVLPHRALVTNHALRKLIASLSSEERASIKRRASKSGSPGSSGQGRGPQKPQPAKRGNKRGKAATGNGGGNNKQQHNSAAAVQTRGQAGSKAPTHNSQHGSSSAGASGGSLSRGGLRQQGVSKGADPALAQLLTSLDLGRFLPQFVDEEMDMEAFGMLTDEDLQEMNIAKGPRLKLLQAIHHVGDMHQRSR